MPKLRVSNLKKDQRVLIKDSLACGLSHPSKRNLSYVLVKALVANKEAYLNKFKQELSLLKNIK